MFDYINEYLMGRTSLELRTKLMDGLRTATTILGEQCLMAVQKEIQRDEAEFSANGIDFITEALLGLIYQSFLKFGITLDQDAMEHRWITPYCDTLELLANYEQTQYAEQITSILELSDTSEDVLFNVLQLLDPDLDLSWEDTLDSVSIALIERFRTALREAATQVPDTTGLGSVDEETAYLERIRSFREQGKYLDTVTYHYYYSGANLRVAPELTLDLLKHRYSVLEYPQLARELIVLCTYAALPNAEVIPTAKRIAQSFDPEVELALADLLGGR